MNPLSELSQREDETKLLKATNPPVNPLNLVVLNLSFYIFKYFYFIFNDSMMNNFLCSRYDKLSKPYIS